MAAITRQRARERFLGICRSIAEDWSRYPDKTPEERTNGAVFSVLALLDGVVEGFPAVDLVLSPHPEDRKYCQENGEDWFVARQTINAGVMLHDDYYKEGGEKPGKSG